MFKVLEVRIFVENFLRMVFVGFVVSFFIVVLFMGYWVIFVVFCVFEFGLGIYWFVMFILWVKYVLNKMRVIMTSVFRISFNILVVALLFVVS